MSVSQFHNAIDLRNLATALGGEVSGDEIRAPGPGHSAKDRSLSVKVDPGASGGFIVHSHAGDDWQKCRDHVREKAGLGSFKPNGQGHKHHSAVRGPQGSVEATYDYRDESGVLLYQVVRLKPKSFRQRRPDDNGNWIWKLGDTRRVLYRLPELLRFPDATVFVCEGEKDADRVACLGHCATTVASGKWTEDCVTALAGHDIIILQDNDGAGEQKAKAAAQALHRVVKTIRIVLLPDLKLGGDVSDWLDADPQRADKLVDVCFDVPEWTPGATLEPDSANSEPIPLIKSSKEFVADFVPPDYLVDGLLQEAFLYSLTGATGAGKTAITLRLAASVALGIAFANRETKKRRVLYLAAENPADVRMRWIALSQQMDFDAEAIEVFFVEGAFKISQMAETLKAEAESRGGEFGLVIIDTGPVFYEGDDENNRTQQARHAVMLRELIDIIPRRPAVIANVHPVKNAQADNLLPAGGGSFLNQVDGNLTAAKTDNTTELHWQGKFRGVEFAPMYFMLKTVTHERLKDSKGRHIPTVVCDWISEGAKEEIAKQKATDEDRLLQFIQADPKATLGSLAAKMEWRMFNGDPYKVKVGRAIKSMKKLVKQTRGGNFKLTDEGKAILKGEN
jgi:AAA domain